MRILDSRRLTGPSLLLPRAGVIAEVAFEPGEDIEKAIVLWKTELARAALFLGMMFEGLEARRFAGNARAGFEQGAALGFMAPLDLLLAASDLNDLAITRATNFLAGRKLASLDDSLELLRQAMQMQANPRLIALDDAAREHGLLLLSDDTEVSIGSGERSRSYPATALPRVEQVPWSELSSVPIALITGTNGKTTTARLLAHVCAQAGKRVGLAATDYVAVAGEVVERGDFTGPAAARLVLRDHRVQLAVLETARGGILRRGLAVDRASCALITNVADDHLGEYGVDTVQVLARAKATVARVVEPQGRIVLNADDAELISLWRSSPKLFPAPIIWFSLDGLNELLDVHLRALGEAFVLEEGMLIAYGRPRSFAQKREPVVGQREPIIAAREVPITLGGDAEYNIANALAAAALASALGLSLEEIARGLSTFQADSKDNPGRGNLFTNSANVRVLIDFGHNAPGVHEVGKLVANLRAPRPAARSASASASTSASASASASAERAPTAVSLIAGCAGDRSDENLRALAVELFAMKPRRVLLRDLEGYLRGRAPGEVPAILRDQLVQLGLSRAAIEIHPSETAALQAALDGAIAGELVVVLAHLEEKAVATLLQDCGFHAAS